MLRGYSKFLDVLEKVEKAILAVTVGIMVIIIAYQVIMRYIFAHANSWSEELARYLFIYDVMIGAAIAIRRNSHLQIDILINLMKPKVRTILTIIATLAGMVFMVFLLSYSITLVQTRRPHHVCGAWDPHVHPLFLYARRHRADAPDFH